MTDSGVTQTSSSPAPPRSRWERPLVAGAAASLAVSTVFPVLASLVPTDRMPAWVGYLDVGLAATVVLLTFGVVGAAGKRLPDRAWRTSFHVYRGAASLLLVLLALFFIVGDGLLWNVLLPGLAWRAWLFVVALPAALTVWGSQAAEA